MACLHLLAVPCLLLTLQDTPSVPRRVLVEHTVPFQDAALAPDGKVLVALDRSGGLRAWELGTGTLLWKVQAAVGPGCRIDVGGERIVVMPGLAVARSYALEDGEEGKDVAGPNAADVATCVAADDRDRWAWIGTETGVLTRVIPREQGGWSTRPVRNGGVTCLAQDPRGKVLAVGGRDGTVRFVNPSSASVDDRKVFEGRAVAIAALAFDGKGTSLVAGDANGGLRLWVGNSGKSRWVVEGRGAAVTSLAFQPRGKWIAVGYANGVLELRDPEAGELRATLSPEGPDGVVKLIAADELDKGKTLVVSLGKQLALWDLAQVE